MAFDAGLTAAVVHELEGLIVGARIDKIYMPEKDEVILLVKGAKEQLRLLLSAGAGTSRLGITSSDKENPANPPMFCMLLRKYIAGGHILSVRQLGFERAVEIAVSSRDEMGFVSEKYLIIEIMGTYSNVILCDENRKIMAAVRYVDLSASAKRQILPGFPYELPPVQEGKLDTLSVGKEEFLAKRTAVLSDGADMKAEKFIVSFFRGVSPLVAREIAFKAAHDTGAMLSAIDPEVLWFCFNGVFSRVREGEFEPYIVYDKNKKPIEYSFIEIRQYGADSIIVKKASFGELLDSYCGEKDRGERIKQHAQDVLRLLSNASARITKKIELQQGDLAACAKKDEMKRMGDLITANMYMLKKGMTEAHVIDYSDENMPEVTIPLEINLTPSQNAQKYYKKYAKQKSAEEILAVQIENAKHELEYIDTVFESLTKAETEKDLEEIRSELSAGGYAKKLESMHMSCTKAKKAHRQKMQKTYKPMEFVTSGGWRVVCGKNNLQNDYITTTLAGKDDYWFHVKGMPGSHTVLMCGRDEPDALDFTEAAMIAAYYSKGKDTPQVPVDYTRIRNVKKPSSAKPGFVIYERNYTAYVTADSDTVLKLKK